MVSEKLVCNEAGKGFGTLLSQGGQSSREGTYTLHILPVEHLKCWGVCKKPQESLAIHRKLATPTAVQRSRWSRGLWQRAFC